MPAEYLVRFDDICPTMNWTVWRQVEEALLDAAVRPILAVVPDNRDPELAVEPAQPFFWDEVRRWQKQGWAIGLHGYQHRYVTPYAGIIGRNRFSEFAGLPYETQLGKLRKAMAIFAREGVRPDIWVAPAHSFDEATLCALAECRLRAVSDGYAALPYKSAAGVFWIPQQLGRFRELPAGIWTVCMHHNRWNAEDLRRFRDDLANYRSRFTTVADLQIRYGDRSEKWMDRLSSALMSAARTGRLAFSR